MRKKLCVILAVLLNLATPMLSIDKYVSFLFGFILPFGVA